MDKLTEMEVIIREAAREALKMFKKEQKAQERKSILHNTETLLKRYLDIKDYMQTARMRVKVMEEEIILRSILRNKVITKLLIEHIDTSLDKLTEKFPQESRVLQLMYLNEHVNKLSWDEQMNYIAAELNTSNTTVPRWRRKMIDELSLLIFGADGIKLWTI